MSTNQNDKGTEWWNLELECKPDFEMSMKRIYAWYEGEIIDRAPVRFTAHNSFVNEKKSKHRWTNIKDKWLDVEFQVESFLQSLTGKKFLAETFPVYWPNLGPNIFASFYGCTLEYDEVTSWAEPCISGWYEFESLKMSKNCENFKKIEELTKYALEVCTGKFMVGYTDLHPGLDCVAAFRGTQDLCMDFYDYPEEIKKAVQSITPDFLEVFDHFDSMLKERNQLSVTWMGIPSFGKMHIPSCDFSAMISKNQFIDYCIPVLKDEVKHMTHNVFHLDGKDVTRHLDVLLEMPEINAIQWVQGMGDNKPIMQWMPLIKKIRAAGKSVVVDLDKQELEDFITQTGPEGILLCIPVDDEEEQKAVLRRVEKW